jgi:hypothetical protein
MNASTCLFMFATLLLSGRVLAREEVIATITNDENKQIYTFVAETNDETDSIKAFYKDNYSSAGMKVDRELMASEKLTEGGLVLEKRGDHEVLKLNSENFDLEQGGMVTIDTLYNGVNGQRKEYDLQLAKATDGEWRLFKGKNVVSKLHIVVNKKFMLGAVGVKEIVMK